MVSIGMTSDSTYHMSTKPTPVPTPNDELILNGDYNIAKAALDQAARTCDIATIRRGLETKSLRLRREVIEVITDADEPTVVPLLLKTLRENQTWMSGGTETALEQREINVSLIKALRKFTGLEFKIS